MSRRTTQLYLFLDRLNEVMVTAHGKFAVPIPPFVVKVDPEEAAKNEKRTSLRIALVVVSPVCSRSQEGPSKSPRLAQRPRPCEAAHQAGGHTDKVRTHLGTLSIRHIKQRQKHPR